MRLRNDRGQAMTEYLMILGLMTTLILWFLRWGGVPIRKLLQGALACVLDDCGSVYW